MSTIYYGYKCENGVVDSASEKFLINTPTNGECISCKSAVDDTGYFAYQSGNTVYIYKINADGTYNTSGSVPGYSSSGFSMALSADGSELWIVSELITGVFTNLSTTDLSDLSGTTHGVNLRPVVGKPLRIDAGDNFYHIYKLGNILYNTTYIGIGVATYYSICTACICFALEHQTTPQPDVWTFDGTTIRRHTFGGSSWSVADTSIIDVANTVDMIVDKNNSYIYTLQNSGTTQVVVRRERDNPDTTITYDAYVTGNIDNITSLTMNSDDKVYFCGTDRTSGLHNFYRLAADLTNLETYCARIRATINSQDYLGFEHSYIKGAV